LLRNAKVNSIKICAFINNLIDNRNKCTSTKMYIFTLIDQYSNRFRFSSDHPQEVFTYIKQAYIKRKPRAGVEEQFYSLLTLALDRG
jgi:hypothetical protein